MLEAIHDRGEYVRDQLSHATPVFALSRPEGILLVGVGLGQSKVFEIYDRHAIAALGNPVDIEKIRQTAIEAAHLEGFNRSPQDVTLRRLMSYSLSPALKNSFESVFQPPLIVEGVFAEVGETPQDDVLMEFSHDGNFGVVHDGLAVVSSNTAAATQAKDWLRTAPQASFQPQSRIRSLVSYVASHDQWGTHWKLHQMCQSRNRRSWRTRLERLC